MKTRLPQKIFRGSPFYLIRKSPGGKLLFVEKGMHFKIQTEKDGRMMNLKGRNFLKLMDYTPEEILCLIDLAADLKKRKRRHLT